MSYTLSSFGAAPSPALVPCGSKPAEIKALQAALNDLGYTDPNGKKLKVDGNVGAGTAAAFKKFAADTAAKGITDVCKALFEAQKLGTQTSLAKPPVVDAKKEAAPPPPGGVSPTPAEPAKTEPQPADKVGSNKTLMLAIGGVAVGGLLLGALLLGRRATAAPAATPNRVSPKFAYGDILTIGKGARARKLGHHTPPKKYRKLGATKPSDYAWPEGYMYPIHDPAHVRAAASRFARFKRRYPEAMRETIAKRINEAKHKFGIGGEVVRP